MESEHSGPLTPEQFFAMSPEDRAQAIAERHRPLSLEDLDPAFRARVEAKSRQLVEERGLTGGGAASKA